MPFVKVNFNLNLYIAHILHYDKQGNYQEPKIKNPICQK
jgi:hypothetical protein